jgi:hypothetical protein
MLWPTACSVPPMPSLADTQKAIRDAIVDGRGAEVLPLITGGRDPTYRLSIHQRHYRASLVDVLQRRFPTLTWLVGEDFLAAAAADYAVRRPPTKPALGEYGEEFPAFLAARPGAEAMPWLAAVGAVEWRLSDAAAAIEAPSLTLDAFAAVADAPAETIVLRLQGGMAYVAADWPVDVLVRLYLDGNPPEQLAFDAEPVLLEIRGARGAFAIARLDAPTFAFRRALTAGRDLAAALTAAEGEPGFDPGAILARLFADGAVTAIDIKETP